MKKIWLVISITAITLLSSLLFGCVFDARDPYAPKSIDLHEVGEVKGGIEVTSNGYTAEGIDDGKNILITQMVTIQSERAFIFRPDDFLLEVCNPDQEDQIVKYNTSIDYNIEKNGYDIFAGKCDKKTTYSFCYVVPNDDEGGNCIVKLLLFQEYYVGEIEVWYQLKTE